MFDPLLVSLLDDHLRHLLHDRHAWLQRLFEFHLLGCEFRLQRLDFCGIGRDTEVAQASDEEFRDEVLGCRRLAVRGHWE
jgi:hypothetical protein